MAIDAPYRDFDSLSDEELTAALQQIEAAILSCAQDGGQRTISIGSVSFSYYRLQDWLHLKQLLVDAYNARINTGGHRFSPYKITHLMR